MEENIMSLLDEMYNDIVDDEAKKLGINVEDENFRVMDANQANFFLRRLDQINKEKKEINDMCDKEIEDFINRVNSFRNSKTITLDNTSNFFTSLLEKYAQNELSHSNKKSLKLPFGTLQFKKSLDKYEYEDEKVLAFISDNNLSGLTRTKIELSKKELKSALVIEEDKIYLNDKEIEGVKITPGSTSFSIKL